MISSVSNDASQLLALLQSQQTQSTSGVTGATQDDDGSGFSLADAIGAPASSQQSATANPLNPLSSDLLLLLQSDGSDGTSGAASSATQQAAAPPHHHHHHHAAQATDPSQNAATGATSTEDPTTNLIA